ncbi:MAG: endonuclease/exonuclease/phosphatase family protein [Steroidobacteraceae bacterium]
MPRWVGAGALALALCAASSLLARWFWPGELAVNFVFQQLLACAALAALAWRGRLWRSLAWLAPSAVVCAFLLARQPPPATVAERRTDAALTLIVANMFYRNEETHRLAQWLRERNADIVVLSEMSEARVHAALAEQFAYRYCNGAVGTGALCVASRVALQDVSTVRLSAEGPRELTMSLKWRGQRIRLLAVHLTWPLTPGHLSRRDAELAAMRRWRGESADPVIIAGDFNLSPASPRFAALLADTHLRWLSPPMAQRATWPAWFPPVGLAIDHILFDERLRPVAVARGPRIGSDHWPLLGQFEPGSRASAGNMR